MTLLHLSFLSFKNHDLSLIAPQRAVFQQAPKGKEVLSPSAEASKENISDQDYATKYLGALDYFNMIASGKVFENEPFKDIPESQKKMHQMEAQKAIDEIKNFYDPETITALKVSDTVKKEYSERIDAVIDKYAPKVGPTSTPVETRADGKAPQKELTTAEILALSEARRPFDALVAEINTEINKYVSKSFLDISAFQPLTDQINSLKIRVDQARDPQEITAATKTMEEFLNNKPVSQWASEADAKKIVAIDANGRGITKGDLEKNNKIHSS